MPSGCRGLDLIDWDAIDRVLLPKLVRHGRRNEQQPNP